jgi:hypothetical protein
VAVSQNGTYSAIGTTGNTTSGNATLSTTNFNIITWTSVGDAVGYLIVRTSTTGSLSAGVIGYVPAQTQFFEDTGQAIVAHTSATQFFQRTNGPGVPTVTTAGTAGSSTYQYKVAAILPNGVWSSESTSAQTTAGNATLSATNYNTITGTNVTGAVLYAVDRTSAGGTLPTSSQTGIIGFCTSLVNGLSDIGQAVIGTYANISQTTPNPLPAAGTCYGMALGTLAASTTGSTLVPVWMGGF